MLLRGKAWGSNDESVLAENDQRKHQRDQLPADRSTSRCFKTEGRGLAGLQQAI